jgi:hypothetical protein
MLNKILFIFLLGVLGLAPASAQTGAAASRMKGKIIAARVQGHVTAISKAGGEARVLHDGDQVSERTRIVTSPGANVILVFSNGATVNLAADSTLDIEEFEQDPFGSDLKVSDMKREPGTSVTKLNLAKGELVGKVVHLNVDKGSEFTVQTPVGAAGIRGTTFRIIFRPARHGKAHFVVTTADGVVVFKGLTSEAVSIPAGKQVEATFDYTFPTSDTPGSAPQGISVTLETTDVSAAEATEIQVASQQIVTALVNVVFPPGDSAPPPPAPGNNSSTNNNPPPQESDAPPPPTNPLPSTTPGAGL